MSEAMWVRSHVERLLQDEWSVCRVSVDSDGDYPFQQGTAAAWVSIVESDPVMVRVWAHAALGVKDSLKMMRELNDIQLRAHTASISWSKGIVYVSQTLSPIGLTQPVLAQAVKSVGGVADDIGMLLASMYGGTTPHSPIASESEDVA